MRRFGRFNLMTRAEFKVAAWLWVWLLAGLLPLYGQDLTCVFVAPTAPLTAGSPGTVWLYCMNNTADPVRHSFDPTISAQLVSEFATNEMILTQACCSADTVIGPGSFVRVEYRLDIPATVAGQARLDVSNYNQFVVSVAAAPVISAASAAPVAAGSPAVPLAGQSSSSSSTNNGAVAVACSELVNFYDNHLSNYEPIYFLLGTYPAAEFQYSLKYRLLSYSDNWHPWNNLYFAYTQTSYWDLLTKDPSFYDTSYKPSAFLYYPDVLPKKFPIHLDLQGGAEHESNGRGGTEERSLYTVYIQPTVNVGITTNLSLTLQPRAWYYLILGDNNQDMAQYRGYADLRAALTWQDKSNPWEKIQLASKVIVGDEGSHPGVTVDFRFNLPHAWGFNPAIQAQYFYGYGQTLRQYNELSHGFRVGLCLWY